MGKFSEQDWGFSGERHHLAVSVKTVRRYIAAGDLDAVRLGRRTIRVRVESLDELIDAHPVNTWRNRAS